MTPVRLLLLVDPTPTELADPGARILAHASACSTRARGLDLTAGQIGAAASQSGLSTRRSCAEPVPRRLLVNVVPGRGVVFAR